MLKEGTRFVLDSNESAGDAKRVFLPHPEILGSLEEGHSVLVDDGKLRLEVEEVSPGAPSRGSRSAAGSRTARA